MDKKRKQTKRSVKEFFQSFGLRETAAVILIISAIVALVGVCIPEQITMLVGLYLYVAGTVLGVIEAIRVIVTIRNRRATVVKRAIVSLVILGIVFVLALTGILVTHINGIFN